jgi:hypothetical protein
MSDVGHARSSAGPSVSPKEINAVRFLLVQCKVRH